MADERSNLFSVSRNLLTHDIWLSDKFTKGQAWVDLIGLARWKPGYWKTGQRKVAVDRGQLCWSMLKLCQRWHWSYNKVKRFLNELKTDEQIDYQNLVVTTLITITNYNDYQLSERPNESIHEPAYELTSERPNERPNERQKKKDKKVKKVKKDKKGMIPSYDEWIERAKEVGCHIDGAKEAFDYYQGVGWLVKGGNRIKDWKAVMSQAMSRDKGWNPDRYKQQESLVDNILSLDEEKILKRVMQDKGIFDEQKFKSYCQDSSKLDSDVDLKYAYFEALQPINRKQKE